MNSTTPQLKYASRRLRRLQEELAQQGTPFQQLPWRDGVDLWHRYVARTSRGQILLEFDGREWRLSFAPPGAKYFATQEDWLECIKGPVFGGYLFTGASSVSWIKELLNAPSPPQVNIANLDRIVEKRLNSQRKFQAHIKLIIVGSLAAIVPFALLAAVTKSAVGFGAVGALLATVIAPLGALWRIRHRQKMLGYTKKEN